MANINPNCPCKNVGYPRHGNCEECKASFHASGGLTNCKKREEEICQKTLSTIYGNLVGKCNRIFTWNN